MSEIKSLIDYDIIENIDHSAICVKFAMMSKQIESKDKEIERLKEENEELKHKLKLINSYVYGCDIDSLRSDKE